MTTVRVTALAALALAFAPAAQATQVGTGAHPFGLGIMLGYPTGISAKYYLADRVHAIDVALATSNWDFGDRGGAYLHASYLVHPSVIDRASGFELTWHAGVGGVLWTRYWGWGDRDRRGDTALGVRVPLAIDFDLTEIELQFFGEVSANVYVWPGIFIDIGMAVGVRYYF